MLSEDQRRQVQELILAYIGSAVVPTSVADLIGPIAFATSPPGLNGPRMARWILDHALGLPDPRVFIQVVQVSDDGGALPEVHELVSKLQADATLWNPSPVALWVPAEWPFLDREKLREVLRSMAQGVGPPVITIQGPDGAGKRTMAAYIQDTARLDGTFTVVAQELRPDPAGGVLDVLVARLRQRLNLGPAPDTTHEEPERRANILAQGVITGAATSNNNVWLVVNVAEVNGLEAGLLRFLDEILKHLNEVPPIAPRLRVVLLASEIGRLNLKNLPPLNEPYVLPDIAPKAVTDWLAAAVPGKADGLYALSTSEVFQEVERRQAPASRRLSWISFGCQVAHNRLASMIDG